MYDTCVARLEYLAHAEDHTHAYFFFEKTDISNVVTIKETSQIYKYLHMMKTLRLHYITTSANNVNQYIVQNVYVLKYIYIYIQKNKAIIK